MRYIIYLISDPENPIKSKFVSLENPTFAKAKVGTKYILVPYRNISHIIDKGYKHEDDE